MAIFVAYVLSAGLLPGFNLARFEQFGRPLLESHLGRSVTVWSDAALPADGAALSAELWRFVCDAREGSVFALPRLAPRDVNALGMCDLLSTLRTLPADSPVNGLELAAVPRADPPVEAPLAAAAVGRTRAWMRRTLAKEGGLGLCPYTQSDAVAAGGLEAQGVGAAAVMHAHSGASDGVSLLRDFWESTDAMLRAGEGGVSSIVMCVPSYDGRWDEWHRSIFPLLESSLVASGLSRTLGIVCFHPSYSTPPAEWLATHRFGHMHSDVRLRAWVDQTDPELSAATSDEDLHWAGSYQRRSPHAVINVLWSRQLEAAEGMRRSSSLYTRNARKCLQAGRAELERCAAEERDAAGVGGRGPRGGGDEGLLG